MGIKKMWGYGLWAEALYQVTRGSDNEGWRIDSRWQKTKNKNGKDEAEEVGSQEMVP